jgi:hypothetical protein
MIESDDLWARYLEEPYRANPLGFLAASGEQLTESKEDKGKADLIMGMEVQGLAIPPHNMQQRATVSIRELRRHTRAGTGFQGRASARL